MADKMEGVVIQKDDNDNSKDLIIIGRSGNGLTSLEQSIHEDKEYRVIDSKGIGDEGQAITLPERRQHYINLLHQRRQIHAILFVMKYGIRFTQQEKDAVSVVKLTFGENVFKAKVVIVFTYGDLFRQDMTETADLDERFMIWCRDQFGDIKTVLEEADYRCVLFDNKTRDIERKTKQWLQLKSSIQKVEHVNFTIDERLSQNQAPTNMVAVTGEKTLCSKIRDMFFNCKLHMNDN
ncbi:AIG protein [Biomphalaria pfeifferi]|uniref:AIG protein n=1 Tax=Biomphalaria pfeifferi TaxID=112525 RepID=A0AAD8B8M9_BIOPF|nr:AIG protein [Biomphalaria pfeifferi]